MVQAAHISRIRTKKMLKNGLVIKKTITGSYVKKLDRKGRKEDNLFDFFCIESEH